MGGWVWAPAVSGPLAPHAAGFEQWLMARGFSGSGVSHRIWQLDVERRLISGRAGVAALLTAEMGLAGFARS